MNLITIFKKSVSALATANLPTPELDTKVLISNALNINATKIFSHPEMIVTKSEYSKIRRHINRRKNDEPIAYITGHKEFFGHEFIVNKNTLIPRPESEWLVEQAICQIKDNETKITARPTVTEANISIRDNQLAEDNFDRRLKKLNKAPIRHPKFNILDLGTGSGCLIISIVKELAILDDFSDFMNYSFYASDISHSALRIATKNAVHNKVDGQITFLKSDLLASHKLPEKLNLIIANLPYVPENYPDKSVAFEPKSAIFAPENGTNIIKNFLNNSTNRLATASTILIELDPRNGQNLQKYAQKIYPTAQIKLYRDLAGLERYLSIAK